MTASGAPLPPRGLNAVGSAGLALEAVVVLLAAAGVASLERGHVSGLGIGYILALAGLLIIAAAWLRRPGGKPLATLLQPLVILAGVVTWPMYVVGVAFAAIWVYWLRQWPHP
ncbi:MAG TPA: DUF4233 domain-containing protein [Mycobacteriales bacterium]|nr:DUF4233 domain-containing protein [Mycobacteriales bacterium]